MKTLNSNYCVRILDDFDSFPNVYIVTEYCNKGDLYDIIKDSVKFHTRITEPVKYKI